MDLWWRAKGCMGWHTERGVSQHNELSLSKQDRAPENPRQTLRYCPCCHFPSLPQAASIIRSGRWRSRFFAANLAGWPFSPCGKCPIASPQLATFAASRPTAKDAYRPDARRHSTNSMRRGAQQTDPKTPRGPRTPVLASPLFSPKSIGTHLGPEMSGYFSPPSTTFSFIFPLMEICDYMMDPDGDVVIVLENPNAPFAVWDRAPAQDQDCTTSTPVKFRASSKHLQLASPVFKAALKGPWIEGSVTKRGYRQINTSDWDVEAFRIVLNVIHGCNHDVPRVMALEMLCKVAVLVDYYQCHEAFGFSSLVWFNHLRGSFSETYGRDLILWLCVSYVFGDNTIFNAATKAAIRESSEMIRALALPISERVISTSWPDNRFK